MIKSIFAITGMLFLLVNVTMAQHFNIGAKAGLNLYTIEGNHISNPSMIAGVHLGVLGHIHLTEKLALQPEITYSTQGAKTGSTKYNLGYINIPVLLQYMFNNGFRLQAGPQIGVLLHADRKTNNNTTDISNDFKSIEAAVSVGASYVHPPTGFGADIRYNHGITDISEVNGFTANNQGVQIGLFYLFNHRSH